ncbi:MAG: hypothetical protein AAF721_00450 [Myxococcota bacterium]
MALSAWLVGSYAFPDMSVAYDGAAVQTISSGTYFLRHATAAQSLLDEVLGTMAVGVTAPAAVVLEDRRIRLSGSNSFDIDFNGGPLGTWLGFENDTYAAATSHTAENVSPLLWSPGFPATPTSPEGTAGYIVNDRAVLRSADMTRQQVDTFNEGTFQELTWTEILAERLRVDAASAGGGTFHEFLEQSAKLGYAFTWYTSQDESTAQTPVTWDDANSFGPYALRVDRLDDSWYERKVANVDLFSPLELPLMLVT